MKLKDFDKMIQFLESEQTAIIEENELLEKKLDAKRDRKVKDYSGECKKHEEIIKGLSEEADIMFKDLTIADEKLEELNKFIDGKQERQTKLIADAAHINEQLSKATVLVEEKQNKCDKIEDEIVIKEKEYLDRHEDVAVLEEKAKKLSDENEATDNYRRELIKEKKQNQSRSREISEWNAILDVREKHLGNKDKFISRRERTLKLAEQKVSERG